MNKYDSEFQKGMEEFLVEFKEKIQYLPSINKNKMWQYSDIGDNLYHPIKHGFLQFAYDTAIPFHDYINHVRSSQAFGINIFYPLLRKEPDKILSVFSELKGIKLNKIIGYSFEYSCEKDVLGEWKSEKRPDEYITSTDIAIFMEDTHKKKYAFLIEVKFTEVSFSSCGGFSSKGNNKENREICDSRDRLYEDYKKCYLHRLTKGKSARKYFDYFGNLYKSFPNLPEIKICPFKNNNQCLRNHALARALKELKNGDKVDYSYFGLAFHDRNSEIQKEWDNYCNLLSEELKQEVFSLPVSKLIRTSGDLTYLRYFKDRYKIG